MKPQAAIGDEVSPVNSCKFARSEVLKRGDPPQGLEITSFEVVIEQQCKLSFGSQILLII